MMLKNSFSSKDPEITVGIVMPSDNASNLELVLSESDLFELETDNNIYPSCKSLTELSIVIKHDKLHLPELNVSSQVISLIPTIDSHDAHLMIKNVKAGRGFHWEKELNLKYWGKHEFSIVNGSMIVKNILKLEEKFNKKVVTYVRKFDKFYMAESRHQNYYKEYLLNYIAYKKACRREEILKRIWNK